MGHAFGVRVQKVHKVQKVQRVVVAASPQFYSRRRRHTILPSEPALSVGGTGGLQGRSPGEALNPGAERRLNPLAFGNTAF